MELNRYVFYVKKEANYLLVNLLNGIAVLVTDTDYTNIKAGLFHKISPEIVDILKEKGFVIPHRNCYQPKFNNVAININITNDCNFSCDYCYFKANNKEKDIVSVNKDFFLDWINRSILPLKKNIYINYLGGEPLIEFEKIIYISRSVMNKANENGIDYKGELTTNGYYLTPDKARKLVDSGIKAVQITIDGNKTEHDSIRRCNGQSGTYDNILKNIGDSGSIIPIIVRININKNTTIESIKSLLIDLKGRNICHLYFSIIEDNFLSDKAITQNNSYAVSCSEAVDIYKKAWSYQKRMGFPFIQKIPSIIGNCIALNPYGFSINFDGKMYVCPSTCGMSGYYVDDLYDFKNNRKKNFRKDIDNCRNCNLYPLCMGGCDIISMIGNSESCQYVYNTQLLENYFRIKYFE